MTEPLNSYRDRGHGLRKRARLEELIALAERRRHAAILREPRTTRAGIRRRLAEAANVGVETLFGPDRHASIARVRFAAMAAVAAEHRYSLPQIGRLFDRDHTTVLYGIRRACELSETDSEFAEMATRMVEALQA